MQYPLVSVIIPVYNAAEYLSFAIESILTQSYENIEVLIIDDCSKDDSLIIANKYAALDNRIRVVCNQENYKQAYSRNIGINLAKGRYLAFLDADDIAQENRIQMQVEFLMTHRDVLICGGQTIYINKYGDKLVTNLELPVSPEKVKAYAYLIENPLIQSSVTIDLLEFRKSGLSYNEIKGDLAEDYSLWLDALVKGYKIVNLSQVCVYYRVGDENQTTNRLKNNIYDKRNSLIFNNVFQICQNRFVSALYSRMLFRTGIMDFILYLTLNFIINYFLLQANERRKILDQDAMHEVLRSSGVCGKVKRVVLKFVSMI